eukprot:scaffold11111_cov53-Phaeocystis_antarctica.AAC.2
MVLVARLSGAPGLPLRGLANPLLHHPSILSGPPIPLHRLVVHRVPLPRARHQYVVGTFSLTQIGHTSCFSRSSPISDGRRAQPKQARLIATPKGAPPSPAAENAAAAGGAADAGGAAAAASLASLSAFSAASASRTSLAPAPRSGCCPRSLASSGLGPSSGSASHSPRTASRRSSAMRRGRQPSPTQPTHSAKVWGGRHVTSRHHHLKRTRFKTRWP